MSNEQTTQQWTQAAVAIDTQIIQIEQQIDTAVQQQLRNSSQILQLRQQLNSLPPGSAARAAVDQQMLVLSDQNNQLTADQAQLSAKLSPLEISLNNATNQATASSSGPPNTSVVPPPATTPTTIANTAAAVQTPPASPLPPVVSVAQDSGENVFNPGVTYNGPATEESVFDPRQDVGENVFDPAGAVPGASVTDAAARLNDPYYGLTPAQLEALGGADPTDPYIRARLGIPQLSGSTLNPGGFAAYRATGVPLIDNAISAISSFASSLSNFFGPPTKPAVTARGTTTGAQAAIGTPINVANAQTARDQPVNPASDPSQFPAYDDDGNLQSGFAVNNETGETYFQGYPGNANNATESVFDPRQDVGENVFDPGTTYNGPATEESVFDPRQDVGENVFDPGQTYNGPATEESVFDPRQDVGENVFDPGETYNGPASEESVFDPRQDVGENVFDPGTTYNGPATEESVFDPRQDPAESVFDPGQTYNGPATEESVFDPRQDVGENVFDPDSAVPSSELADAAVGVNDPYYGLSPAQLEALGGADPTDPYIRARLGIPQLPGSTLNPGGFAALTPTGVPLIDNALSFISNLFGGPPAKKADVATEAAVGTKTAEAAAEAAAVGAQNPNLTDAEKANLDNIQVANEEVTKAEENIQANNRTILAAEEGVATARENQRGAEAIIAQNNAELADENISDERRAELEANNSEQYASIAENAQYIDDTTAVIDGAEENNKQQQEYIQENQVAAQESQDAFAANNSDLNGDVDANQDPVLAAADAAVAAPLEADPSVTIPDDVAPEEDPVIAAAQAAVAAPLEANPNVTIPDEVDPDASAELAEPPGTEVPYTELAEPPDPDADPEQLAGPEDLGPYTELAEPPTDEPEQLGDPELQDGEITDLAEPVDPDADPELVQLGGPTDENEETGPEQLSGPPDVDPDADPGVPDGLSDEEQLARQNEGGLSDEEILARQSASEQAAAKANTINQATLQSRYKQPGNTDWRVRLALAPTSDYLYNASSTGILAPLAASNGVIFPYMPQISTAYRANYEQYDLVHSNFRGVYYKSSRVDDIQIRGTFTAQDTTEAAYLLATIHFFRSVTKMFYGKDAERGTPPPLVYLSGLGDYQFSKHPCLVSQFSYTLPNDVDYIRATNPNDYGGNLLNRRAPVQAAPGGINFAGARRLANTITAGGPLTKGATPQTPQSNSVTGRVNNTGDFSTYVPTMMEIDITLVPVQTRSQVSKQFSLKDFANGNLLKGGFW